MIDQLQFLRPAWLIAFAPLLAILLLIFYRPSTGSGWKSVCDAALLPYVLTPGRKRNRLPVLLSAFIAGGLCILAAAGPAWQKLPGPVFTEQSALVVALDLSQSMDATDIKPSRLTRARLKLLDILDSRAEGQTALLVYAADAFTATPLTHDTDTIAALVPALTTDIMPAQGSNATAALEAAGALLKQAGVFAGDILLITDSAQPAQAVIDNSVAAGYRVSILGIGSAAGGPVPVNGGFLRDQRGAMVLPKLDSHQLRQTALRGNGLYVKLQPDDADVDRLNSLFNSNRSTGKMQHTGLTADTWREEGPWLLLLVIPFAALWARRGWLFCTAILLLPVPEPGYAFELSDLWNNRDQRAEKAFNAGANERAAQLFTQPEWQALAHYRNGKYQKSLAALAESNDSSGDHYYNRGNVLARLGRYADAMRDYEEALERDPANADARYNLDLVKKVMTEQPQNANPKPGEGDQDTDEPSQNNNRPQDGDSSDQQNRERTADAQQTEADNAGQQPSENTTGEDTDNETRERNAQQARDTPSEAQNDNENQESEQPAADESVTQNRDERERSEEQYATEQWLRRIPDDPGGLLRRKFKYQYKRMPNHSPSEQAW